jgi:hypothetical protein
MMEKVVEPIRHAKWAKADVETFFENVKAAFAVEVCMVRGARHYLLLALAVNLYSVPDIIVAEVVAKHLDELSHLHTCIVQ